MTLSYLQILHEMPSLSLNAVPDCQEGHYRVMVTNCRTWWEWFLDSTEIDGFSIKDMRYNKGCMYISQGAMNAQCYVRNISPLLDLLFLDKNVQQSNVIKYTFSFEIESTTISLGSFYAQLNVLLLNHLTYQPTHCHSSPDSFQINIIHPRINTGYWAPLMSHVQQKAT